jgi:uroporphyrinogen decarboxylase
MHSRERVTRALRHQEADRIPIQDSLWGTTAARWQREGMPVDRPQQEFFGWELAGFGGDVTLQLPTECLEETADYRITKGSDGAIVKNWIGQSSTPELLDFTITTRADWDRVKAGMAWNDTRVDWAGQTAAYQDAQRLGLFTFASFYTGFTRICDMCGTDTVLMAMLDDPAWVQDMLMTRAELCVRIAEEMLARGFDFDAGWIWDDLGFKHRSFFSTELYRELVMPAHKLICDAFKARGKFMILHSCGYITELAPLIIETGFDCLQPIEVKAGNDILALKEQYGDRLTFMGGIDVRAMADPDPAVIEREIAGKLPILKQGGGYIYHSDHSVPDNVSYDQYRRVMELVARHGSY